MTHRGFSLLKHIVRQAIESAQAKGYTKAYDLALNVTLELASNKEIRITIKRKGSE